MATITCYDGVNSIGGNKILPNLSYSSASLMAEARS